MTVSVILVNYNGAGFLPHCLTSIAEHTKNVDYEVIIVDNSSTDASKDIVRTQFSAFQLLEADANYGFAVANNMGARVAQGELLFFLNNDTIIKENAISGMENFLRTHSSVGACGPKLLNPDGSLQWSTGCSPSLINELKNRNQQRNAGAATDVPDRSMAVDWVTGAALMIRRGLFEKLKGFDENFFMYFEDVDLCARVRESGAGVYYVPQCAITHLGGEMNVEEKPARIQIEYRKSQTRYYSKHASMAQQFLLRLFLLCKYGTRRLVGTVQQREVARAILQIVAA